MAQNDFTKENHSMGIHGQIILDAGLNVFALQLLIESYTDAAQGRTGKVEFTYLGVDVRMQINHKATKPISDWLKRFNALLAASTMLNDPTSVVNYNTVKDWRHANMTPEEAANKQIKIWEGQ